jgi:hypothetical protein
MQFMTWFKHFVTFGILLWVSPVVLRAQTNGDGTTPATVERTTVGKVLLPEPTATPTDPTLPPLRPTDRPERTPLSGDIKEKLRQFEHAREAYLKAREDLEARARGSTADQRNAIRDRMKDLREEWIKRQREFRDETRDRVRDLQRELGRKRDAFDENIPRNILGDQRPRPGQD